MRLQALLPYAVIAACLLGIALILYIALAIEMFAWRNPKANQRVAWMHPIRVLTFARMPEYQETP